MRNTIYGLLCFFLMHISSQLFAQETGKEEGKAAQGAHDAAELAKKLANPIANLILVPFQDNTDYGIGAYNGSRNTMNFQPVVPISLSPKLNLITRFIIPITTQYDITGDHTKQAGLSDAVVSGFLSPADSKNGLTWGAGPVFLLPIATNDYLGGQKWGIGPTAVALKQVNSITIGALVNQIWSIAGNSNREDISQMFFQPFFTYNWKSGAGLGAVGEITQNWKANTTTAYLMIPISGVTKFGKMPVQLVVSPRIPISGPVHPSFGWRAALVFLFPK